MRKRLFSIILTVTLVVGNMSGLKIKAAENTCVEIEETTVTVDASEEEEEKAGYVDGIFYVPEGVTRIEDGVYSGLSGYTATADENARIEKIVLPSTLEYIGNNAFELSTVEEIVIPGNVKEIGNDAFWACDNLKKVTIEEGVEKIGRAIFRDCENLETVILPKSVKEWNTECAFYACHNLKNITLPSEGLTTLGSGMFGGCPLEELVIPDCVTTMNYGVFIGCEELKTVEAGYNVVNFVQGEEYYDLYSFTLGAFGVGCSQMVLKAPLDSAIVEYARNYRYFTVKYDYPDFERMTYECSGILEKVDNYVSGSNDYNNVYAVDWDLKPVPENTSFEGGGNLSWKELYSGPWGGGGRVELISDVSPITIDMDVAWQAPDMRIASWDYYTQDENLDYTVKHTEYFRVIVTKQSLAERRVQMEVLRSGTWDSEDAEWELITPAIDTSSLTPTPTPVPTETPTPTVEATVIPTKEPTITEKPSVTLEVTITPSITKVATAIPTVTVKPTITVEATPTPVESTVTPTAIPTVTPMAPTETPTPTVEVTVIPTKEPTITEKPSVTPEVIVTPSITEVATATPTVTVKLTITVEATATPAVTEEPTATATPKPTATPTVTPMAPTETPTPTVEATVIPTAEPTVIQKATPTPKIKTAKPGKTSLKSVKQLTQKKNGKKVYKKEVKLTWKKVKNADGYVIYMKTGSGKYKAVKTITKEKTTSYIKRKLRKGKTYYFKVRAYKKVGEEKLYGNYSVVKKVKVK